MKTLADLTATTYEASPRFTIYEAKETGQQFAVVWHAGSVWRADIRGGYTFVTVPTEKEARAAVERAWLDPDGVPYPDPPEDFVATSEPQIDDHGKLSQWGYTLRNGHRGYFRVKAYDEAR